MLGVCTRYVNTEDVTCNTSTSLIKFIPEVAVNSTNNQTDCQMNCIEQLNNSGVC